MALFHDKKHIEMKFTTLVITLFFIIAGFSQELTVTTKYGYAIGEMPAIKKVMLYNGLDVTAGMKLKESIFFNTGIGGATLQFSYSDTSNSLVFNKKYFLTIPASLKKSYYLTKNSSVFIQLGVMNNFLVYDKKEMLRANNKKNVKSNIFGYNLGMLFNMGFRTKMAQNNWYISLLLGGHQDMLLVYKKTAEEIKVKSTALGISFTKIF